MNDFDILRGGVGMSKSRKRTASTVLAMTIFGIAIIYVYFHISTSVKSIDSVSVEDMTEIEILLNKDLNIYYPATPREVVRLYGRMIKTLYTDLTEEESKELALKIRELYDQELLRSNPEENYLAILNIDIAAKKEKGQKITNYVIVNKENEVQKTIDGKEFATIYLSFSIREDSKFTNTQQFILRKDDKGKWKILGWKPVNIEED